jgi:hypothetical protein
MQKIGLFFDYYLNKPKNIPINNNKSANTDKKFSFNFNLNVFSTEKKKASSRTFSNNLTCFQTPVNKYSNSSNKSSKSKNNANNTPISINHAITQLKKLSLDERCFDSEESSSEDDQNLFSYYEGGNIFDSVSLKKRTTNNNTPNITAQLMKWKFKFANAPKQNTSIDSGIFICKFLEYLARGEPIIFSQEDIEYFRVLMSIELIESKLITE